MFYTSVIYFINTNSDRCVYYGRMADFKFTLTI